MPKKWIYLISNDAVAKVNSEVLLPILTTNGFSRCSYQEYLSKKAEICNPSTIEMDGKYQAISLEEELARR